MQHCLKIWLIDGIETVRQYFSSRSEIFIFDTVLNEDSYRQV